MAFADTRTKPPPFGHRIKPPIAKSVGEGKALPTVMIMAYDWGTGAHAVVTDRLSQALQNKGCKVVIFTDEQTKARMEGFTPSCSKGGSLEVIAHRQHDFSLLGLFEDALNKHRPDVLITEHYPMSRTHSPDYPAPFQRCLESAKRLNPRINIQALVRDIPDVHDVSDRTVLDEYDHFLIRGDERIYSYAKHFADDSTWQKIEADKKVHYVGYAAQEPDLKTHAVAKNNSVVVSLGGGNITDDPQLYKNIIAAIKTLPPKKEYDALRAKTWHIYAPQTLGAELEDCIKNFEDKIKIHSFDNSFDSAVQKADMVVCRAGMTAIESIAQGLPTLMIPRRYGGEQRSRAEALEKLSPKQTTYLSEKSIVVPSDLHEPLKETLTKAASQRINTAPPFKLGGHEHAADAIIAAFRGEQISTTQTAAIAR